MYKSEHTYVVILCGGGGTRLWPLSRNNSPKQFIDLIGSETLFEKTLARALRLVNSNQIYIMTNRQYLEDVKKYRMDVPLENIISEPEKKNTALAMGVISGIIHARDPLAVVINLASDQLINDDETFVKSMLAAAQIAAEGTYFVTVGITPAFPHTGLGYIQSGHKLETVDGLPVLKVDGFREKPNLSQATQFVESGKYYWNANLYTWSTKLILEEFEKYAPHQMPHIKAIMSAVGKPNFEEVMKQEYQKAKEEQIDTAISEKTDKLAVIPGNFGWTDIGSWNVVHDEAQKDMEGNALISREAGADWFRIDTTNSLVSTGKKQIVTIGLDGVVIIDTPDAILIARKERAQDVKKVVEELKQKQKLELL